MSGQAVTGAVPLDLLVVGSGVAGLSAAVRAAEVHGLSVGVLTKGELAQATTRWAQGGVAAVLGRDPDSTDLHHADTLAAGAGLCDPDAVRVLVDEGPGRVEELIALGAMFDRDPAGHLELAREGGHSLPRVVHAGGAATGAEVERALVAAVAGTATACLEHHFALDLIIEGGRCTGVVALAPDGSRRRVAARHVLVTTGGAGQLFAVTTNPPEATGDGIAMALRAGAAVADLEFVQFHPTALHHHAMPRPLLSEALRGHGALLRDGAGERFCDELAPRDVVSRAETGVMAAQGTGHVWLDATGLADFDQRFPTLAAALATVGLDPSREWLPVAPAAHYTCGGIVTDLAGAGTLPGLWAAGEAACTGVHGANRLASNSLLEGMVFGPRAVEAIAAGVAGPEPSGAMRGLVEGPAGPIGVRRLPVAGLAVDKGGGAMGDAADPAEERRRLQGLLTATAGVLRDADGLARAADELVNPATPQGHARAGKDPGTDSPAIDAESSGAEQVGWAELTNLVTIGRALVAAATARAESRGAHHRLDHPEPDESFAARQVVAR